MKERVRLTTAERQEILNRLFPNGNVGHPEDWDDLEETHLGYCDGDILEVRFWLDSNIDFNFYLTKGASKKKMVNKLINIALDEKGERKRAEWYQYKGYYFHYLYTQKGFILCFCKETRELHAQANEED